MVSVDNAAGDVAPRANRDAGAACGDHGAVVVEGDVAPLLKFKVFVNGDERLRHLADGDYVSAVGIDLGGDEFFGSVGERDDHDDGGDADDDAEQREDAAHLVGPEGLQCEPDAFNQFHESAFPCAAEGTRDMRSDNDCSGLECRDGVWGNGAVS